MLFYFSTFLLKILAPGTYSPEKVVLNKSPKFSFGIKTHRKIVNDNPGKLRTFGIMDMFSMIGNFCIISSISAHIRFYVLLRLWASRHVDSL